jgi:hypothetical protein
LRAVLWLVRGDLLLGVGVRQRDDLAIDENTITVQYHQSGGPGGPSME